MKKQSPNRNSSTRTKKKKFESASLVLKSFLIILLLTCIIVGICMLIYVISFKNGDLAIDLDNYKDNQNQTSIVYAQKKDGTEVEIARLHGLENRIWVKYEDIPQNLKDAFVSLEDKRFYKHHGVDWKRTVSAATIHHFSQGGSTITQQLIKNLTQENAPTFARKFNEILYALNLEEHFSKTDILEAYLNTIPLGSGCYGVQTAAKTYFGKDVGDLNLAECAVLSCITKAPTKYNPLLNPQNTKMRQETCLKMMYDQEKISKEQYEEAKNYKLIYTNSPEFVPSSGNFISKNNEQKNEVQSYYVDYVVDNLIHDFMDKDKIDKTKAWEKVYYGGLKIYTCIDMDIQSAMEDVYENRKTFPTEKNRTETGDEKGNNKKVQSAMTVMDYRGRIVGIVGGAGKKTGSRSLNRAAYSKRQPGSSIKPLSIYAPAIEKDIINWSAPIENYAIMRNGELWPHNYGGTYGNQGQYVTVQHALAQSLNTVPARILQKLTPRKSLKFIHDKFGIKTEKEDADYAPLATGAMNYGVTTLEMAAAFATFGNGGYYHEPYCYTKVTNFDGSEVLLENKSPGKRVLKADTADVMNELLRTVTRSGGTGSRYGVRNFTTFAKTGTTTNNWDKWFVGGTPYYVAAVWYGYDNNESLRISSVFNPAGKIFKTIMDPIHKNLSKKSFKKSGATTQKSYCKKSGLLAGEGCTDIGVGWYKLSSLPGTCVNCTAGETEEPTEPGDQTTNPDPENPTTPDDSTTKPTSPITPPITPPSTAEPEGDVEE